MDEFNPLCPSVLLSTRRAWSELPEERPVHAQLGTSAVPEEELAPYEDDNPLAADFTMPEVHKVPWEDPVNNEPEASLTSQDLSKLWEAPGMKTDRFPVELSPFIYLNSQEKLEDELIDHYGVGVIKWLYEEPHLILMFMAKDRAFWALESQRRAMKFYPSEPSARPLPYQEGQYSYWGKGPLVQHNEKVNLRCLGCLKKYPPPKLIQVRGSLACPPHSVFKSAHLTKLLYPEGFPRSLGMVSP
jgi:hypothetical protein